MLALLGILATTKTAVERENGRKKGAIPEDKSGFEKVTNEDIQVDVSVDDLLLISLIYLGTCSNP